MADATFTAPDIRKSIQSYIDAGLTDEQVAARVATDLKASFLREKTPGEAGAKPTTLPELDNAPDILNPAAPPPSPTGEMAGQTLRAPEGPPIVGRTMSAAPSTLLGWLGDFWHEMTGLPDVQRIGEGETAVPLNPFGDEGRESEPAKGIATMVGTMVAGPTGRLAEAGAVRLLAAPPVAKLLGASPYAARLLEAFLTGAEVTNKPALEATLRGAPYKRILSGLKVARKLGEAAGFSGAIGATEGVEEKSLGAGVQAFGETMLVVSALEGAFATAGAMAGLAKPVVAATLEAAERAGNAAVRAAGRFLQSHEELGRLAADAMSRRLRAEMAAEFLPPFKLELQKNLEMIGAAEAPTAPLRTARAAVEGLRGPLDEDFLRNLQGRLAPPPEMPLPAPVVPASEPGQLAARTAAINEDRVPAGLPALTMEEVAPGLAQERRVDFAERTRRIVASLGGSEADFGRLSPAQTEVIALLPEAQAKTRAVQIVKQVRSAGTNEAGRVPTQEVGQMTTKAGRRDLIRTRAEARKPPPIAPEPVDATERLVREYHPRGLDLMSADEVLDEMSRPPKPIDLSQSSLLREPGPVRGLADAFQLAEKSGLNAFPIELPPKLTVEQAAQAARGFEVKGVKRTTLWGASDTSGRLVLLTDNLQSFLAELGKRAQNSALAIASEPLAEVAFAEDPDDDEQTRQIKASLRTVARLGGMAAILPLGRSVRRTAGEAFEASSASAESRLFRTVRAFRDDGALQRFQESWAGYRQGFRRLLYSTRLPEELNRLSPLLGPITTRLASAQRSFTRELEDIHRYLYTDAWRRGVKPASLASEQVGKLLDGIATDDLVKLPSEGAGVLKAWRDAAQRHFVTAPDASPARLDAAREAIDALYASPPKLRVAQQIARIYRGLRERARAGFRSTFTTEIGSHRPWVLVDTVVRGPDGEPTGQLYKEGGQFVERYATEREARDLLNRKARAALDAMPKEATTLADKPIASQPPEVLAGLRVINSPLPTVGEEEAALGRDVPAYLTRLMADSIDSRVDVSDLARQFPGLDPANLVTELRKLGNVTASRPYSAADGTLIKSKRAAFESVFGTMTDAEYKDLVTRVVKSVAVGESASRGFVVRNIPQRMFVKFYRERTASAPYSTDAIKAISAYSQAVLRDIHFTPLLPDLGRVVDSATVSESDAALKAEFSSYTNYLLGRNKPANPELARTIGGLSSLAYNAILWARLAPATANLLGQTLLIGLPEMGFDTGLAALVAILDPKVLRVLSSHDLIRKALPLGEKGPLEALRAIREGETGYEKAMRAVRDVPGAALNFMGMSEALIRTWAYVGGVLESMKKDGTLKKLLFNPLDSTAPAGFRQALTDLYNVPPDKLAAHNAGGEDMVRRVAFFFEAANMPSLFRNIKNFPSGNLFTMFANFPINYANRFTTQIADIFSRKVSSARRTQARGFLIRHLVMTTLVGGPLALPLIRMMTKDVSASDPGLGGQLRAFLQPYQDWIQQTFFAGQHMSDKFATTQPIADLLTPKRFETAPLVRLIGNAVSSAPTDGYLERLGLAHPALTEELRQNRQRFWGALTPYSNLDPAPDDQYLPEAFTTLIPGGGMMEDVIQTWKAREAAGQPIEGPLDMRGRLRTRETRTLANLFLSPSESKAQERLLSKSIADKSKSDALAKADVLRAIVDPTEKDVERTNAIRLLNANPTLLYGLDQDAIRGAIEKMQKTALERQILGLSPQEAQDLRVRLLSSGFLHGLEGADPKEARRVVGVWMAVEQASRPR